MSRYPKQSLPTYVQYFPQTFAAPSTRRVHPNYNFYSSAPPAQTFLTEVLTTHHPGPTILHIEEGKVRKSWKVFWALLAILCALSLLGMFIFGSNEAMKSSTPQFAPFNPRNAWDQSSSSQTEDAIVQFILSVNDDEESYLEDLPFF